MIPTKELQRSRICSYFSSFQYPLKQIQYTCTCDCEALVPAEDDVPEEYNPMATPQAAIKIKQTTTAAVTARRGFFGLTIAEYIVELLTSPVAGSGWITLPM